MAGFCPSDSGRVVREDELRTPIETEDGAAREAREQANEYRAWLDSLDPVVVAIFHGATGALSSMNALADAIARARENLAALEPRFTEARLRLNALDLALEERGYELDEESGRLRERTS